MGKYSSKGSETRLIMAIMAVPHTIIRDDAREQLITEIQAGQGRDAYEHGEGDWVIERDTPGRRDDRWTVRDWNAYVAQGCHDTPCDLCDDIPGTYTYIYQPNPTMRPKHFTVCGRCVEMEQRGEYTIIKCPHCDKHRWRYKEENWCMQCMFDQKPRRNTT